MRPAILKTCTAAFVSLLFIFFPQNGIGCSGEGDPHDYFVSFFSKQLGTNQVYRSFYYTSWVKLYDDYEGKSQPSTNEEIINEWKSYAKISSTSDAEALIYGAGMQEVDQ